MTMSGLDNSAKTALKDARTSARERGAGSVEPLDVIVAAMRTSPSVAERACAPYGLTWEELHGQAAPQPPKRGLGRLLQRPVSFTDEARAVLLRATGLAGDSDVTARHLAAAALEQHDDRVGEVLAAHGTTADQVGQSLLA